MLNSLEIQNYRNLRRVDIKSLGKVNLLIGKNNTGKTSLLEAIAIYINKGNPNFLLQLLDERGENYIKRVSSDTLTEGIILKTLSSIFNNRRPGFKDDEAIVIGEYEDTLFGPLASSTSRTTIKFIRYLEHYEDGMEGVPPRRRRTYVDENVIDPDLLVGIEVVYNGDKRVTPLKFFDRILRGLSSSVAMLDDNIDNYQFVRTKNIDRDINGSLWDKISLTDSEDEVVNALRIIERDIDRITFRTERGQERVAVAKLSSSNDVVPLRSMGDGINRILTIILAMVNCENGYILIDEFENGLHYSTQEALWKIIFSLAERLNIQVFTTTHSNDTIRAFANIIKSNSRYSSAKLIKLRNIKGDISSTIFDSSEMNIVSEEEYLDLR